VGKGPIQQAPTQIKWKDKSDNLYLQASNLLLHQPVPGIVTYSSTGTVQYYQI